MILSDFQDGLYNIVILICFIYIVKLIKKQNKSVAGIEELSRYYFVLVIILCYELYDEFYITAFKEYFFSFSYLLLAYYFSSFFIIKNIEQGLSKIFNRINFILTILLMSISFVVIPMDKDFLDFVYVAALIFIITIIIFGLFSSNSKYNLGIIANILCILLTIIVDIQGFFYVLIFILNILTILMLINNNNVLIEKNLTDFREKMEIQEKILKFIAHDLKAPLVSINAFNNDIQQKDSNGDFYHENEKITESVNSISILLDKFVNLSKIKTRPLEREWKNLDLLVRSLIFSNSQLFTDIEYQITYELDNYEVYLDEFYFGRVIKNLLENAVKYRKTDEKLLITTSIEKSNNGMLFTFSDNGIGIDSVDYKKIFETNYRVETKKDIEGLGYGLALIKFIIDKHEWIIDVDSKVDEFTTFQIYIPMKDVKIETK